MCDTEIEVRKGDQEGDVTGEVEKKTVPTYPLIRHSDIPEESRAEICDLVTALIEKYSPDIEGACKAIKEEMDRVYGAYWNVVVGFGFGFEVSYQKEHLLYFFFGGNMGILIWK